MANPISLSHQYHCNKNISSTTSDQWSMRFLQPDRQLATEHAGSFYICDMCSNRLKDKTLMVPMGDVSNCKVPAGHLTNVNRRTHRRSEEFLLRSDGGDRRRYISILRAIIHILMFIHSLLRCRSCQPFLSYDVLRADR